MMEQRQMLYSRVVQGQTTHTLYTCTIRPQSQSGKQDSSSNVKLVQQHGTNVRQRHCIMEESDQRRAH